MELLKKNIIIKSWGIIYLGLKKSWLTKEEFYAFLTTGKIHSSEYQLIEFYLIEDRSLKEIFNLVEKFMIESNEEPIIYDDTNYIQENIIPINYYEFWEMEFLLRLINSNSSKEDILNQVDIIHSDFNYPVSWHSFIYFMPPSKNSDPPGIDGLYSNLLNFIDKKIKDLQIRKEIEIENKGHTNI